MEPIGRRRRPSGVRRALLPLLALVGFLAAGGTPTAPAAAQQDDGGIQVEVEAGYDGRYLIGRRLPVRVSIRADRLVRGAVEVTSDDFAGSWILPLEVPGGSEKDVLVVVPTPNQFEMRSLTVRVVGAGDPVVVDAEVEPLYAEELVGLLPELAAGDLPPPLELPMEAGTARFAAIDDTTLAAAGSLDPLGTIVAGPDELGRLDGAARAAVLDWVDRGGRLVVDGPIGTDVAGLPTEWQPGPAGRIQAGLGEVRAGNGAAVAGRWSEVLEPTPTVSLADLNRLGSFQFTQFESVGDSVARDAGLSALDLPWLLAFLAVYVALVGPIAWLVLRRGRPALGWVVIPGLAVLFTGIAYVVGSDLRGGTRAAQGSIVDLSPAGARTTTVVGTVSRSGGDGRTRFPAGWTAGAVDNLFFGGPLGDGTGVPDLTVTEGAEGAETEQTLAAGGFGVVRGTGPDAIEGGLVVSARTEGDEVVGTVRNDLPWPLARSAVFLGRAAEPLGTIAPGEEVEFRFTGVEAPNGDIFSVGEGEVWQEEAGMFGPPAVDSPVNLGLWNEVMAALGPNGRARGTVTAVGWTANYRPPVDAVGDDAPTGRSAVVGRAPVAAGDDGSVARGGARRELIRGFDGVELPDDAAVDQSVEGLLWRLALPAGTGPAPLQLDVPAYVARVELWDGSRWVQVDDQLAGPQPFDPFSADFTQPRAVAVPPDLVRGGAVWVRGWVVVDGPVSDGIGLELRTVPEQGA